MTHRHPGPRALGRPARATATITQRPVRVLRSTGKGIRDKNGITFRSTKRPTSRIPVRAPVPVPPPHPAQRVPKPQRDDAFRHDAVPCWLNSSKPAHVIAAGLGNKSERLYSWPPRSPTLPCKPPRAPSPKTDPTPTPDPSSTPPQKSCVSSSSKATFKNLGHVHRTRPSASKPSAR